MIKIIILRTVHGLFALYFTLCLVYLYYAAIFSKIDGLLVLAIVSLGIEGVAVFILNKGDCPLIHVQKKIGDDTPFFNLILPAPVAKRAVPFLAKAAWIGIGLVVMRVLVKWLS